MINREINLVLPFLLSSSFYTGADITKHDGVYSRHFTQFTEVGFYGIKITVVNNGTALVLGDPLPASRAIPNLPIDDGYDPPKIGTLIILIGVENQLKITDFCPSLFL